MKFLEYIKHNYRPITLALYLLPILFSVIVSLAHVVAFWEITNPFSWAVFLSIAIEIAVLTSIAASRLSNKAWVPFIIVTIIQIIGNIFYSFNEIVVDGRLFKSWVEMVDPIYQWFGATASNIVLHKRIIAMSGAFIPLIAIVSFNFFIRAIRMNPDDLAKDVATSVENSPNVQDKEPEITDTAIKNEKELVDPVTGIINIPKEPIPFPEPIGQPTSIDKMNVIKEETIKRWEDLGLLKGLDKTENTLASSIKPVVDDGVLPVAVQAVEKIEQAENTQLDIEEMPSESDYESAFILPEPESSIVEPAVVQPIEIITEPIIEIQEPVAIVDVENVGSIDSTEEPEPQPVIEPVVAEELVTELYPDHIIPANVMFPPRQVGTALDDYDEKKK